MDIQVRGSSNQCSLKWSKYEENLVSVFDQLFQQESLTDVTLSTEGKSLRCHKVVLSACSSYFKSILADTDHTQHPIVILKDISWLELRFIVDYMYRGEINISQEELPSILKIAESLEVHGLVDFESKGSASGVSMINNGHSTSSKASKNHQIPDEVRQKRKRRLVNSDEDATSSEADSIDLHKAKSRESSSPLNSSPSPSSMSQAEVNKERSMATTYQQKEHNSSCERETPQPPNLVHKPPPPPTNSPMTASLDNNGTPPKLKDHRMGSFLHSPSIPLPPSLNSPSTSGIAGNHGSSLLPNLSHFQNQHQKMFPNLPSSHSNALGMVNSSGSKRHHFDDMSDVKPSILEMIQEERRVSIFFDFLSFCMLKKENRSTRCRNNAKISHFRQK